MQITHIKNRVYTLSSLLRESKERQTNIQQIWIPPNLLKCLWTECILCPSHFRHLFFVVIVRMQQCSTKNGPL